MMTGYKADFADGTNSRKPNNVLYPSIGSIVSRELGLREESARPAARLAQAKVRDWMKWLLALEGVSEREMDEAIADVQRLVEP